MYRNTWLWLRRHLERRQVQTDIWLRKEKLLRLWHLQVVLGLAVGIHNGTSSFPIPPIEHLKSFCNARFGELKKDGWGPTHKFFWIRNRIKEAQIFVVGRPCRPNPLEKLKTNKWILKLVKYNLMRIPVSLQHMIKDLQISQKGKRHTMWSQRENYTTPLSARVLLPRALKVAHRVGSYCWSVPACKSKLASDRSCFPSPGPPRSPALSRASNRARCNEAGGEGLGNPALSSRLPVQFWPISTKRKKTRVTSCLEAEPGGRWKPTMLNASATNGCFTYLNLHQYKRF